MRVGVLEIGSNKVGLQVVDAQGGSAPLPAYALKTVTRLAQAVGPDGSIDATGATRLYEAVTAAAAAASEQGVDDLLVFATSALRDAPNVADIRSQLADQTGVLMRVLSGEDEARLTFLAARRWFGWRAGRLLLLDIGGGSFEIAAGRDEAPDFAISLPLGAGRLTREFFSDDPPSKKEVRALRRHVKGALKQLADRLLWEGTPERVVVTSKTFKQLARMSGAPPRRKGPFVRRLVERSAVREHIPKLTKVGLKDRAKLAGVCKSRASQIIAGALTAEAAMTIFGVRTAEVSPWALREGVLLRRLDGLADPDALRDRDLLDGAAQPSNGASEARRVSNGDGADRAMSPSGA